MKYRSEFQRWRKQLGLTQQEAADELGISRSQVINYDTGRHRAVDTPSVPPLAIRKLMTALALGCDLEAWPE